MCMHFVGAVCGSVWLQIWEGLTMRLCRDFGDGRHARGIMMRARTHKHTHNHTRIHTHARTHARTHTHTHTPDKNNQKKTQTFSLLKAVAREIAVFPFSGFNHYGTVPASLLRHFNRHKWYPWGDKSKQKYSWNNKSS